MNPLVKQLFLRLEVFQTYSSYSGFYFVAKSMVTKHMWVSRFWGIFYVSNCLLRCQVGDFRRKLFGFVGFGYFFRIFFPTVFFIFLILPNFRRTVRAAGSTISFLPSSLTCNMVPLPKGKFESVVSLVGR